MNPNCDAVHLPSCLRHSGRVDRERPGSSTYLERESDTSIAMMKMLAGSPKDQTEARAGAGAADRRAGAVALVLSAIFALVVVTFSPAGLQISQFLALVGLTALAAIGAFALAMLLIQAPLQKGSAQPDSLLTQYAGCLDDGLLLSDAYGAVTFANQAFYRMLDRAEGSLRVFQPSTAFGDLGAGNASVYRLTHALASGEACEEVIERQPNRHAPTSSRWLRIALSHHLSQTGESFASWRLSDVTQEHTRQSESLQRLKRSLDQLDRLPAGLFVAGADGRLSYLNATLADWLGIDRKAAELSGIALERLLSADGLAGLRQAMVAAGTGDVVAQDVDLLRQDGVSMPVRLLARSRAASGSLDLGLILNRAPSDRLDDGSQAAEARFTRLFHAAPVAIATIDAEGRIGSANPAFSRLFFSASDTLSAGGLNVMEGLTEASQSALRHALSRVNAGETPPQPIEITYGVNGAKSGQLFLAGNTAAGAERESVILYALDTTERKELEAQFAQSQKMQAIGQLAGGIAHDINNVLTVIIGFSDLLLVNSAGDPAFHDLVEIKSNANRAANLVKQLLAFSRRQTLRPEVLSLNETISDLSVFLKRTLGEKVKLERDYGRDLWLVKADQTELGRVLVNLAVNANDAMPTGGMLTIRTANISRADSLRIAERGFVPGDYVECSVSDTGHGMSAEVLKKIFEPFFTTKDVGKGTGLGLSTVYGIVKQTGGYVFCESEPGVGTTFRIFLPRHAPGAGSLEVHVKAPEKREKARDVTGTGTVLLVEDEDSVRKFAARALRRQGYNVLEAGHGAEALEVMAAHVGTIDLVVSDVVMPEMDGPTLLKELRRDHPDLKFVFMSGYTDDALATLDNGEEFAFLQKPFQLAELVSKVKEIIQG